MSNRIHASVDPRSGRVEARTDEGHSVVMDGNPPHGASSAASPIEALLASLAGCTALDVSSILRKKRQVATSYEIAVTAERAPEHPRVITRASVEHRVSGEVDPEALRRSIELSATRYCPVSAMLSVAAVVEHRYRLTRDDGTTDEAVVSVLGPDRLA
jgi:putative redox protein